MKNCSNFKFSDNKYVDDSNGDSYISARSYVGGYFGQLSEGTLSLSGSNYLMVTINGSSIVGGIAGYIENVDLNVGIPLYSSQSAADASGIEITGTEYLGGLVGKMLSSSLSGPQNLNPTSSIPSFDNNNTVFIGNITGNGTCIGGAVGRADKSSVKGISVRATITNNSGNYTGGIVGYFNEGNKAISSCSFSGPISGKNYTGGIVGEINTLAQVTQCINYGSITGENPTGGIVGKANNKTDEPWINECVNVGKVKGSQHVGGIVGLISADGDEAHDWTKVARCGNFGAITASSSGNGCVGGIVGKCDSDKIRVNDCANNDSVTGYGSFKGIGGIAGSLGKDGILNELDNVDVYNCANTGKIISDKNGESHMGGIVGYLEEGDEGSNDTNSQVHLCYNCGEVGPAKSATHGGIIGHADYYVSLRYCINYGKTGTDGEAMIGTVVTGGIVHDTALYHLKGTGDNSGRNWSSTEFTESQMNSLSTFKGFSSSDWKVGKQINMSGSGENNKDRVILVSCPFQNMTAPK